MPIDKPTDHEDEFFFKMDMEKIKERREGLNKKREEESKHKEKETHWMKCPKCGSDLKEINLNDVMIDLCIACKGIWLDSGELKLLTEGEARLSKGFISKLFG